MATFTSRANEIGENVNSPSDSVNRMAAPGSCLNPKYALPKPAIMRRQVDMPLATAQLTSVARNFKCGNVALSAALLGSWSGVVLIARARSIHAFQ